MIDGSSLAITFFIYLVCLSCTSEWFVASERRSYEEEQEIEERERRRRRHV
jgi:hypothetical protein